MISSVYLAFQNSIFIFVADIPFSRQTSYSERLEVLLNRFSESRRQRAFSKEFALTRSPL